MCGSRLEVKIRRTCPRDSERLRVFRNDVLADKPDSWQFSEGWSIGNGLHYHAEINGKIIGLATITKVSKAGEELYELGNALVHKEYQGMGVFTVLSQVAANSLSQVASDDGRLFVAFRSQDVPLQESFASRGYLPIEEAQVPDSLLEFCASCPRKKSASEGCCCKFLENPRGNWGMQAPTKHRTRRGHREIHYDLPTTVPPTARA
eukprot:TRINITY_DN681_c4_g1_i1.p1 TRINITY_DN681_c4_g1~~TRINITY_DN681_c4_g1_i1.p1  ORF type:complete len:234 (+),score=37.56 TRINITY_DN681_c4_g1_i1:86-703(+)